MKIKLNILLFIFFVSANINAEIPRASVENLIQLTNSQIAQGLAGYRAYGVEFATDEDGIETMQPFDEIFVRVGYSEISYFPTILSLLEKDPLQVFNDLGINLNSSMSQPEMWKIIRDTDRTDAESYSWQPNDDQLCYKQDLTGWSCVYFYVGGPQNNQKGYFSDTQSSDFYARIDILVEINPSEDYYSDYYDNYLDSFLNNNLVAEQKKLDAKNLSLIQLRDSLKVAEQEKLEAELVEQERIAVAKKVIEKKKAAEKRIVEEKRIAEEKRIVEEKRIAEEKRIVEEKRIADLMANSRLNAQNNPGFRDLKPGLHYEDVLKICPLNKLFPSNDSNGENASSWVKCYGINNIKFKAHYTDDLLDILLLDMGPIVDGGFSLDVFGEGDSNIYTKMKKSISDKYTLEYEYSERDRQLFNESEKSSLLHVYSKGQVVLEIARKTKDFSSDLWLFLHYRDSHQGELFLEKNKPVRATSDDF